MKLRYALALGMLLAAANGYYLFLEPSSYAQSCQTGVSCGSCGLTACSIPGLDATSATLNMDSVTYLDCNTALIDELKCGKSDYCAQSPIPSGCPGHGEDPPPPPSDPWRCRWTTVTGSGYNSCTFCWLTDFKFICCELPT